MVSDRVRERKKWYDDGLCFECAECGYCCSGPQEGYIWITRPEIARLSAFIGMDEEDVSKLYLKRIETRTTIIEESRTRDCIFLTKMGGQRGCAVYPVRPNQCRTWPFWPMNLQSADEWNAAGARCPGINRGRLYSLDEIETIRRQTRWWDDEPNR
ncbi:MAG: YkgJ family cysteine cluster protein [Phycisphaerae bacterium]|nr:YkgJ family cysteine cluster protein [Phycisphaerae bacterium]